MRAFRRADVDDETLTIDGEKVWIVMYISQGS
jgi:hypothetical protein